ncbi:MAG: flagellar motor protein MotB, partial [Saccharothrix sp.]|nr:flagellar motor protein MotB [Saccharothrix sp.]
LRITVVGHTDNGVVVPGGRFDDNVDLGVARAGLAARELAAAAGLPLTDFAVTSTGAAEAPFPNTTTENQDRNRTVSLRLSFS